MKLRRFVMYWLPALVWIGLVLVASSEVMSAQHTSRFLVPFLRWLTPGISPETLAAIHLLVRKLAHITEYAILAALVLRAFRAGVARLHWMHVVLTFAIAAACAVSDEFHQSLVATRTGSAMDVAIDLIGALIGIALYCWLAGRGDAAPENAR